MRILITTLLGIESLVAGELKENGVEPSKIEVRDGRVYINNLQDGKELTKYVALANIHSRCAERVLIEIINEDVRDFDRLFELVFSYPFEKIIQKDSLFIVRSGFARKSELHSIPTLQGMIKKAIVKRLLQVYGKNEADEIVEDASKGSISFHFSLMDNKFSLAIDTSGEGLHKRSYRLSQGEAPLKETLAAAIVYLSRFRPFSTECLIDPMCGSGTILIEAAQMAINMAPGINRSFAGEDLFFLDKETFAKVREEARSKIDDSDIDDVFIFGYDIDNKVLEKAKLNARRAGVFNLIKFEKRDILQTQYDDYQKLTSYEKKLILTNPPYGERMFSDVELDILLQRMKNIFFGPKGLQENLRLCLITADFNFENSMGFAADKRRKVYNGMIPCNIFQYFKEESKPLTKSNLIFASYRKLENAKNDGKKVKKDREDRLKLAKEPRAKELSFDKQDKFGKKSNFSKKSQFNKQDAFPKKAKIGGKPRFAREDQNSRPAFGKENNNGKGTFSAGAKYVRSLKPRGFDENNTKKE